MRLANSALIVLALWSLTRLSAADEASVHVVISDDSRALELYLWNSQKCDDADVPDVPVRAYRDREGKIEIVATNSENYLATLRERPLRLVRLKCESTLTSPHSADPQDYADNRFLAATWTRDGNTIYALVHNEYHANEHSACEYKTITPCWYNTITYARSDDGGRHFVQSKPPTVVAAVPFKQNVGQGRHRGFFNPTNILRWNGAWWFFSATTGWPGQGEGSCLFRSGDIDDPRSWRGWEGSGFSVKFGDPYLDYDAHAACKIVVPYAFTGIYKRRGSHGFMGILTEERPTVGNPGTKKMDVEVSFSDDLLNWSKPQPLISLPAFNSRDCGDKSRYAYPSLLDPRSEDRNFADFGTSFLVVMTRAKVIDCRITNERDLIGYEATISDRPE